MAFAMINQVNKMATEKLIQNLELFQKRMEIIVGARLRINDIMEKAVAVQDKTRSKVKFWSGSEEIRKWREKR